MLSRLSVRTSVAVDQLGEELYTEFLETVGSFLNTNFAIRHMTVSLGEETGEDQKNAAGNDQFKLTGGDWLTITNRSDGNLNVFFPESKVFGVTEVVVEAGLSATLRVDESIEAVELVTTLVRETPQLIIVEPPKGSDD